MTAGEVLVTVLAGIAIAVGVIGCVLPVLPGTGLVWLTMLVYGLVLGFGWPGWIAMVVATVLLVAGLVANVLIPQREASSTGLTVAGQLVGLVLAVVGFFVVPVVGAPLGFTLGVFLVRLQATGDRAAAWSSTLRIIRSLVKASAVQAAVAVAMAVTWMGWVIADVVTRPA